MSTNNKGKNCSNCGAPLVSEICPYCNVETGLDSSNVNMEYPVIECKEANINFWNVVFPLFFSFTFMPELLFPIKFFLEEESSDKYSALLFNSTFGIISIVAFIIGITPVIRSLIINSKGKEIEATVYGYMNDDFLLNDAPAQIVKLLVNTNEGNKFILYQTAGVKRPYKINSKIKLRVYKDMFMIVKK